MGYSFDQWAGFDSDPYWGASSHAAGTQAAASAPAAPQGPAQNNLGNTKAAAMTMNPYVVGASFALDAYQNHENRKQQERMQEYEAKLNKIRSMQQSLSNAAQMAGRISYA